MSTASLNLRKPKHAVANLGDRHGKVVFHQESIFKPTLVMVQLNNLRYAAIEYKVGDISIGTTDTLCPVPVTTFNPANVSPHRVQLQKI